MRRDSSEQVAAIARQRLEDLARSLGREPPPASEAPSEEPGRHARGQPTPLAGALRLRRGHLAVLLVVAFLALAMALWWTTQGSSAPVPIAATTAPSPAPTTSASASPTAVSGSPAPTPTGTVVVDIAGRVRRPGVASLPAGSRVIDALRRAGGARPGIDLSGLNLARVLVDGEQILVGDARAPASALPAGASTGAPSAPVGRVNLNTADVTALDALPGIGPVTAQKIVAWRTQHGSFTAIDELLQVDGIGPKTLADLAPRATL